MANRVEVRAQRWSLPVVANRRVDGRYRGLVLDAPELAASLRPGHVATLPGPPGRAGRPGAALRRGLRVRAAPDDGCRRASCAPGRYPLPGVDGSGDGLRL